MWRPRLAPAQSPTRQRPTIWVGAYQQCYNLARNLLVPAHLLLARWGSPGPSRCLTLKQKQQLMRCAARCGILELLQPLESSLGCEVPKEAAWRAGIGVKNLRDRAKMPL